MPRNRRKVKVAAKRQRQNARRKGIRHELRSQVAVEIGQEKARLVTSRDHLKIKLENSQRTAGVFIVFCLLLIVIGIVLALVFRS